MTNVRIAEAYVEVLGTVTSVARVAEAYVEVLLQPTATAITGLAPVGVESSSTVSLIGATHGISPVSAGSSSRIQRGLFVTIGDFGVVATSSDGIAWTSQTSGFSTSQVLDIAYSSELALFVIVGADGKVSTSPDGTTWTSQTSGFGASTIRAVTWSPSLALFVAVGDSGKASTSPDGTTWTSHPVGLDAVSNPVFSTAVCWGNGLFVVVGWEGVVKTSSDGVTWTLQTITFGDFFGVVYSFELTRFIVVGRTGRISTSPDGVTWTTQDNGYGSDGNHYDIAWAPEIALFVAVGTGIGGGLIITSPDGITWTPQDSPIGADGEWLQGVSWSAGLELFTVVGGKGPITASDVLATSPDGVTWTAQTTGLSGENFLREVVAWTAVAPALTMTGLAPVGVESSSHVIGAFPVVTGSAPATSASSSEASVLSGGVIIPVTGNSPISAGSSSSVASVLGILTTYTGESSDILIPILLTGIMSSIFPPPVPPVDFAGLVDPTVAPTLMKSDTVSGHLLVGTYRYSYAAWKGSPAQATAPSPTADITLTAEDTVTLTYPTIAGADGYLVYREDL